ncbi:MAG: hypothetical protein ACJAYU_003604 [Bradymonadia bacterium]
MVSASNSSSELLRPGDESAGFADIIEGEVKQRLEVL